VRRLAAEPVTLLLPLFLLRALGKQCDGDTDEENMTAHIDEGLRRRRSCFDG
jgi:hypothetical protein